MKRILFLTLLIVTTFTSVCSAIDLSEKRWLKVYDDNKGKYYIDVSTIEYPEDMKNVFGCRKNHRYVTMWAYQEFPNETKYKYTVTLQNWDIDCRKLQNEMFIVYGFKGEVLANFDRRNDPPMRVIPGTIVEDYFVIAKKIWEWSQNK